MIEFASVLLLVLVSLWFVYELCNAPEGYEDLKGFHYGLEPIEEDLSYMLTLHAQLLRHAASALENPNDLTRNEQYDLIDDLLSKANEIDPREEEV
jgi:hypothetical protein